jgi:hypothetical protein
MFRSANVGNAAKTQRTHAEANRKKPSLQTLQTLNQKSNPKQALTLNPPTYRGVYYLCQKTATKSSQQPKTPQPS